MSTAIANPLRRQQLTLRVVYGPPDIERAADSLDVSVTDAEMEAILANLDAEIAELANEATRSAVSARIYGDLGRIARGHAASDDD